MDLIGFGKVGGPVAGSKNGYIITTDRVPAVQHLSDAIDGAFTRDVVNPFAFSFAWIVVGPVVRSTYRIVQIGAHAIV
jgi:hypothetical protein